jgi:hypothetical protein
MASQAASRPLLPCTASVVDVLHVLSSVLVLVLRYASRSALADV